ncbi:MAG: TIR domain-containing protein [Nitrospiraceae bacterium]|nr:MAG: TIR domain-containing protein [Nitrospiraceae bacterium]
MTSGKNKALVIGIDQYDSAMFNELPYAKKDAAEVYRVLTDPDIGVFSKEDVVLLTPDENFRVTKSGVEQKLEEVFTEAGGEDTVLVYFAGHGKLDKSLKLCLAAQDTSADRLVSTSINMETIRNIRENSDCRRAVFIIDSCYSGAAGLSVRSPEPVASSLERMPGEGTIVISASQAFQEALEKDDIKQGIFTDFFIKGLEAEEIDHDKDGYISLDEIYDYIHRNVKTQTKGKQIPARIGTIEGKTNIAKSSKFIRDRKREIDLQLSSAQESLEAEKREKALDAYQKVLKLEPVNQKAQECVRNLIGDIQERLSEYYGSSAETLETDIYIKARNLLEKHDLPLSDRQIEYVRSIMSLLSGLDLVTFEKDWKRIERKEQTQEQQEKDKQNQMVKERESRGSEQVRKPGIDKPPVPQYSRPAKEDRKPETPKQPLPLDPRATTAKIVISYSHKDEKWVEELKIMLAPVKSIEVWYDKLIKPGDEWRKVIKGKFDSTNIAVLFVSKDFIASEFIQENELPPLIKAANQKNVTIFWVLVNKCQYDEVEGIEPLQAAHNIAEPLIGLSEPKLNDVMNEITDKIKQSAKEVIAARTKSLSNKSTQEIP